MEIGLGLILVQHGHLQRFQSWMTHVRYFSRWENTSFPFWEAVQNEISVVADVSHVTRQFQERKWRLFSRREKYLTCVIQLWKRCKMIGKQILCIFFHVNRGYHDWQVYISGGANNYIRYLSINLRRLLYKQSDQPLPCVSNITENPYHRLRP